MKSVLIQFDYIYVVPKSSEELRFKEKTSPADDTDDDFDQSI